mmetsp:Transcript_4476/g.11284  ORF Transcript_4476/g.11284 Transcript_4476/m.11284 type:complete len:350 (-) Transcript_4476:120-1169(-)
MVLIAPGAAIAIAVAVPLPPQAKLAQVHRPVLRHVVNQWVGRSLSAQPSLLPGTPHQQQPPVKARQGTAQKRLVRDLVHQRHELARPVAAVFQEPLTLPASCHCISVVTQTSLSLGDAIVRLGPVWPELDRGVGVCDGLQPPLGLRPAVGPVAVENGGSVAMPLLLLLLLAFILVRALAGRSVAKLVSAVLSAPSVLGEDGEPLRVKRLRCRHVAVGERILRALLQIGDGRSKACARKRGLRIFLLAAGPELSVHEVLFLVVVASARVVVRAIRAAICVSVARLADDARVPTRSLDGGPLAVLVPPRPQLLAQQVLHGAPLSESPTTKILSPVSDPNNETPAPAPSFVR